MKQVFKKSSRQSKQAHNGTKFFSTLKFILLETAIYRQNMRKYHVTDARASSKAIYGKVNKCSCLRKKKNTILMAILIKYMSKGYSTQVVQYNRNLERS